MNIGEITREYLQRLGLTQEWFAAALNASLVNTHVTRVSVSNWLNGKYEPETDFLLSCLVAYNDWRKAWAADCLAAKLPHVFGIEPPRAGRRQGRLVILG